LFLKNLSSVRGLNSQTSCAYATGSVAVCSIKLIVVKELPLVEIDQWFREKNKTKKVVK